MRQEAAKKIPKSEALNPKQIGSQINLKLRKIQKLNPNQGCLELCDFWSFEFVSNFGPDFRASNIYCSPLRPFDLAQDMLCASHGFSETIAISTSSLSEVQISNESFV